MLFSTSDFLEHFRAMAGNFQWQRSNGQIAAYRRGYIYDPVTALVWVSKRKYIPIDKAREANSELKMPKSTFDWIMEALYAPEGRESAEVLRKEIEKACGF